MLENQTFFCWVFGLFASASAWAFGAALLKTSYHMLFRAFLIMPWLVTAIAGWVLLQHVWLGKLPNMALGLFGLPDRHPWFQIPYLALCIIFTLFWQPLLKRVRS